MYRNVYQIFNYDINKQHIKLIKTLFTSVKLCKKKQFNNWSDNKINEYNVLYVEKVLSQIDTNVDKVLKPLRDCVKKQEGVIRALQRINANQLDVNNAVNELNYRKQLLKAKQLELTPINACINRLKLETVLKKRFFFDHSYNIYAPISGIYDYGPVGCALKNNIIDVWRKHFILEEQMLEVDCTVLTPEPVLKASGHVERFADLMVKDVTTGECFRLDHLIKAFLEKLMHDKKCTESLKQEYEDVITKLDGYSKQQMNEVLRKYQIKSPISGNELTDAIEFNLMFSTSIGSGSDSFKAYLRPETAQGIFINFKRLLEFNHKKLPFAAAQIGNAFRNEITPRSGLIRVREFTLAEIEHFVDPSNKLHPKYDSIKNESLILYSACNQMDGISAKNVIIEEAVNNGTIANQTLAYFLARIHSFLIKIGIDSQRLRFRQHMGNEMAHYATDCWDAECLTSYGWVECVGCADRSCYDLLQHSKATGVKLNAERKLSEPKQVDVVECIPQKELIDKIFISDSNLIYKALNCLENSQLVKYKTELLKYGYFTITIENKEFRITKDMLTLITVNKSVFVEEITPEVIEPSFGIGRILYTVLDHNYKIRDKDENRTYFSLPVLIAPYKCAILPLSKQTRLKDFIKKISVVLTDSNISHKIDDSTGSIGKRYTRLDEIAIPFGITIDFDTINTNTATLRERDSMQQIRAPIEVLGSLVNELTNGKLTWNEAKAIYPLFLKQESADQNC